MFPFYINTYNMHTVTNYHSHEKPKHDTPAYKPVYVIQLTGVTG